MSDIKIGNTTDLIKGFTSWFAFVPMPVWIVIAIAFVVVTVWCVWYR